MWPSGTAWGDGSLSPRLACARTVSVRSWERARLPSLRCRPRRWSRGLLPLTPQDTQCVCDWPLAGVHGRRQGLGCPHASSFLLRPQPVLVSLILRSQCHGRPRASPPSGRLAATSTLTPGQCSSVVVTAPPGTCPSRCKIGRPHSAASAPPGSVRTWKCCCPHLLTARPPLLAVGRDQGPLLCDSSRPCTRQTRVSVGVSHGPAGKDIGLCSVEVIGAGWQRPLGGRAGSA